MDFFQRNLIKDRKRPTETQKITHTCEKWHAGPGVLAWEVGSLGTEFWGPQKRSLWEPTLSAAGSEGPGGPQSFLGYEPGSLVALVSKVHILETSPKVASPSVQKADLTPWNMATPCPSQGNEGWCSLVLSKSHSGEVADLPLKHIFLFLAKPGLFLWFFPFGQIFNTLWWETPSTPHIPPAHLGFGHAQASPWKAHRQHLFLYLTWFWSSDLGMVVCLLPKLSPHPATCCSLLPGTGEHRSCSPWSREAPAPL